MHCEDVAEWAQFLSRRQSHIEQYVQNLQAMYGDKNYVQILHRNAEIRKQCDQLHN